MANKFDWGDTQALITEFTRLASRTLHSAEASASEFLDTSLFTGISGTDAADSILGASGQDLLLGGAATIHWMAARRRICFTATKGWISSSADLATIRF
ncbi:MAG: hypothetical protein P8N43_09715 [Alphaproteobacteria bacterium]|nr:hypothetical protein [Alphaproteobacteria bacterium]